MSGFTEHQYEDGGPAYDHCVEQAVINARAAFLRVQAVQYGYLACSQGDTHFLNQFGHCECGAK